MIVLRDCYWLKNVLRIVSSTTSSVTRNISSLTKPVLYGDTASPPMRFVMMTASIIQTDIDIRKIDLFKSENKTEEYKKINPLQKIPAMVINDCNVVCDSHAIALYLCRTSKSKKALELYPDKNIRKASVDEFLFYNSGTLFPIDSAMYTQFFEGKWPANETMVKKWYSSMDYLENKLDKQKWLTGDKMRLCDLSCIATISSLEIILPLLERHRNLKDWMKEIKAHSFHKINEIGLKRLETFVKMYKQRL